MRKISHILCGVVAGLLIAPTMAQESVSDGGLYFSFGGGFSDGEFLGNQWVQEDFDAVADTLTINEFDIDYSLVGIAAIGYVWAPTNSPVDFRAEIEGSYRRAEIDSLTVSVFCTVCGTLEDQQILPAEGYLESIGAMLNGYVDFRLGPTVTPYFGAGIGMARVARKDTIVNLVPAPDKYVHAGAWQVMTGVGFRLSPGTILGLEFRYFEIREFRWDNEFLDNDINFSEFLLTFRLVG